jgi:YidC/Oxa1 family membrane protein insertase
LDPSSGPVILDFSERPALSLARVTGLSTSGDFRISLGETGRTVRVEKATDQKIHFERTITLGDGYRLDVVDTFRNDGSASATLPGRGVRLGPMHLMETKPNSAGVSYMGIDTLEDKGGVGVRHWGGKEIPAFFGVRSSFMSCARQDVAAMPASIQCSTNFPIAWTAAKSKFFVQVLAPEGSGAGCEFYATRDTNAPGALVISKISADMLFADKELQPGETLTNKMVYYVGPKEYSSLKPLGNHQADVMEFGWFEWFRGLCKVLLWTLNALYKVIPNYGIAIILLTLIVRIIFWPVTHKSTESMKKMQEIQPLVTEIRAKYKDKPQKMNEEVMALYKKHKVNPVAGCLPMLVQIPVFIALFVVLRSAVELRFAPFLWIRDLSEPEGILAGVLPFGGLNILPLLMTATTIWQQKLTPSSADPQQQKIMMFMPIVMLFLFYNMASALVLYWTVSQVLAIVQLLWQKKQADAKKAIGAKTV